MKIDRGRLKDKHVMQLLFRRYSSLTNFNRVIASYKEIGERTSIRPATVRNVIERFHAMGN